MKYKVTIETLSPLHIGSGTTLLTNFDYLSRGGTTYVLDQDMIYAAELDRHPVSSRLDQPAGSLIEEAQLSLDSPFVRYTLRGETTIEQIQEQIKDAFGRCYLPGSSLKGALRTALLYYAHASGIISEAQVNYDQNRRGNYLTDHAAMNFEKDAFRPGRDSANYDLLRMLQVADSQALPLSPSPLELCPVRVFTDKNDPPGSPVEIEAVQPGVKFHTQIKIDELSLQYTDPKRYPHWAQELKWGDHQLWLLQLVEILQKVGQQHIAVEQEIARQKGFQEAQSFYNQLNSQAEAMQGANQALLQIGWGIGWTATTIGNTLDVPELDLVRQRFQLGRPPEHAENWHVDLSQAFPKSRRLNVDQPTGDQIFAGRPLGWVRLTIEPDGEPVRAERWKELQNQAAGTTSQLNLPAALRANTHPVKEPTGPYIRLFKDLPQIGDRFPGILFENRKDGSLLLEIPGLDADEQAAALVAANDNPEKRHFKEGSEVDCEVIAIEPDPHKKGLYLVKCRRL